MKHNVKTIIQCITKMLILSDQHFVGHQPTFYGPIFKIDEKNFKSSKVLSESINLSIASLQFYYKTRKTVQKLL